MALAAMLAGFFVGRVVLEPTPAPPPILSETQALEVPLKDLQGKTRRLRDWRGKTLLVNFWATWCPPCLEEIPLFMAAQARHAGDGLQLVGIAMDDPESVRIFRDKMGIPYPNLLGHDRGGRMMRSYGNKGAVLPFSVILGADGSVLSSKLGAYSARELESAITKALATRPTGN